MTGQLLVFAGSLGGVALMILFAWMLGLGKGARIANEAEARELADNAICGFEAREVALDAQGRGALLANAEGRVIFLKPHGSQFAARLLERTDPIVREDGRLTIGGATLELGDSAGAWEARLNALDS